jgi:hypothetical protein
MWAFCWSFLAHQKGRSILRRFYPKTVSPEARGQLLWLNDVARVRGQGRRLGLVF